MFKIRRALVVQGGSVQIGSNVNLYRSADDTLKTDDSLVIGGTSLAVPYGTSSPSPIVNGNVNVYHKGNVARLVVRSGGTAYVIALPAATHGTITCTVNSVP